MAKQMIPVAVAVELINARMRADAALAQHMVLHEALALLIGQLHRGGVLNADGLATELMATFSDPQMAELAPGVGSQAETLAGRIRGAAHLPRGPGAGRPADS